MTTIEDTTAQTDEWQIPLKRIFEMHKNRIDNDNFIPSCVEAWTVGEDEPLVYVFTLSGTERVHPRDAMLFAAKVVAETTDCDYLVCTYDTHAAKTPINPVTGEKWKPGEMQRMCDEQGYCDTGNIRDNLVCTVIRRSDQKILQHMIPYHFHTPSGATKQEILWFDEEELSEWDNDPHGQMGGLIPDTLRAAMQSETIGAQLKRLGFGPETLGFDPNTDASVIRLHQTLAGVRILADTALKEDNEGMFVSMVLPHSEEEAQIIEESARRNGMRFTTGGGETDEQETDEQQNSEPDAHA